MLLCDKTIAEVAKLIGREPRGLKSVEVFNDSGEPSVIRVSSLVDQKPFPTLFWLVDKSLVYKIDQFEAFGLINTLQQRVNLDASLREAMWRDNHNHIILRESYMTDAELTQLNAMGYLEMLRKRGIGGISNRSRVRCLHSWYAAHLVKGNTIGAMLDQHILDNRCL